MNQNDRRPFLENCPDYLQSLPAGHAARVNFYLEEILREITETNHIREFQNFLIALINSMQLKNVIREKKIK